MSAELSFLWENGVVNYLITLLLPPGNSLFLQTPVNELGLVFEPVNIYIF